MGVCIHAEGIVLQVIGSTYIPPIEDTHFVRHGEVCLLLEVLVLHMEKFVIVVDITGIVVGVFGIYAYRPTVEEFVLPRGLYKRVAVPKAFAIAPDIVDDGAWYAALGVVVIEL